MGVAPARHLVVDAAAAVGVDPAEARKAERRAVTRRLQDAAWLAAAARLRTAVVLPLALLPAVAPIGSAHGAPVGAALLVALIAVPAAAWLCYVRRGIARTPRWAIAALSLAVAALAAGVPWLTPEVWRSAAVLLGATVGATAAVALAPLPVVAAAPALAPLAAASSSAGPPSGIWPIAGALTSLVVAIVVRERRQSWRSQMRTLIEQQDRIATLERERDAAVRTDRDKSRFLAIASHDLRQPVHALGLFAATLQRRLLRSPDEPLARNLMRAVDALERSFNAMLDISKLDAGALSPQVVTFPLRDMFRRLHMQYAGQAELAGLGLRFAPGGKSVTSDPQLLERIVGNLIQNAIKYTARGGIMVVARRTTTHVNVEVWDTGCGIAASELPRIFEEFYQVGRGERDRSHGLGMGLAIVKRLAALLGHRLEVASTLGRGTMFRIGAPLGGLPGIQEELAPADTQPMNAQTPQMVLVVDDEEPIREGLRLLLLEWGYQAMTAADGAQAEQAVSALEGRVDLVLSDLHLGDGPDGREVIAQVRRLCGREVPAILVTGNTAHDEVQRAAASGDPVLFKPVQPRGLFDAVRAALR